MAPGLNEALYVLIPRSDDSVLVLLDRDGKPRAGWPIAVDQSGACGLLLAVADGSVRLGCDGWVFGFDANGRPMAAWPVNLGASVGRMIGERLTILTGAANEVWITSIGVDGVPHPGVRVAIDASLRGGEWAIGPDGVAYGTFVG